MNGEDLQTTKEFTYLSSAVRHGGGASSDISLNKARNAFRMLKVWKSFQYSTETKLRLLELHTFNLTLRLRKLEDDCKPPQPTVHLLHQEPSKDPMNNLAQNHLQPTSFHLLQPRQHEHHHHAKAMEMGRACDEKRARQHLPHSPSLDTRGEAETGETQEHLASNCRSLRPFITPGGLFRSWPKTDRGGVPLLLPYIPASITGMSERVRLMAKAPITGTKITEA